MWGRQKSVVVMRRRKEAKIASPCKDVYFTVVAVHCSAPCVMFPHLFVVLCWCDISFYVPCVSVLSATPFPSPFLSCGFCVHHTWVKPAPHESPQLVLSYTGAEELFVTAAKTNCTTVKLIRNEQTVPV